MAKRNVDVFLSETIPNLGKAGDVVSVAPGYARNFLYPRGFATRITPGVQKVIAMRKAQEAQRKLDEKKSAESRKVALETINNFVVYVTVGEKDTLFGTVTSQDIADVISSSSGIEVDKRTITVEDIKKTGVYAVQIKLHPDVTAVIRIQVTPS